MNVNNIQASLLKWIEHVLKWVLVAGIGFYFLACLFIIISRIHYPFELEWMEGGSVDTVRQILEGKKIYVPPLISYAPYGYPPLYFYVCAVFAKFMGLDFFTLRLVSVLAALGCFAIIFRFIYRETKHTLAGFIGLGLFAATYRLSGTWFDIARADMLFLLLLLVAFYLLRFKTSTISLILAGIFISLSFLSKQSALAISLPIMLYCIYAYRFRSIYFIITVFGLIGLATLFLDPIHHGWYKHYVFDVPSLRWSANHTLPKFLKFWFFDLALPLSIGVVLCVITIIQMWFHKKGKFLFYLLWTVGMIGASSAARSEHGGYSNGLLPVYTIMAILFGIAYYKMLEYLKSNFYQHQSLIKSFLYFVFMVQFAAVAYFPHEQIPTKADKKSGQSFIHRIQAFDGDVLVAHHGYYAYMSGKTGHAQAIALSNAIKFCDEKTKRNLIGELRRIVREKKYSAIILDELNYPFTELDIDTYYIQESKVFEKDNVFIPVTGRKTRPEWIFVPRANETIEK